jgi:RNase P/RNase MRP subunit p29
MKNSLFAWLAMSAALLVGGCNDDGSGYIVAGTIGGLSSTGLVLENNGGDNLTVQMGASSFQFSATVVPGGTYDVTVASQPAGLVCTVANGSGTTDRTAITRVAVSCNAKTYTIAGAISGLTAAGLVLEDNGGDPLAVPAKATTFQFPAAVAAGGGYRVSSSAQPAGLTCTVSSGVGTKLSANIDSVRVTCSPATVTLGGTISGLTAGGLALENNGADALTIPAQAATFQFPAPLAYGSAYAVTVSSQPSTETCSVAHGSSNAVTDVTGIVVTCVSVPTYVITPAGGANGAVTPSTAQTVNRGANLSFLATPNSGYGVYQWLLDGSVVQTGGDVYTLSNIIANHTVQVSFATTTLTPSASILALAVSDTALNAALTGNPRQIVISNAGSIPATNVSISYPAWPSGTTAFSTCGSTLAPASTCTITVTPGLVATSACTAGSAPVPGVLSVTSDESAATSVNVMVLGYGCIYQGGYVFAVDDTTPNVGSIAGKVAALTDQAPAYPSGIVWASDGTPGQSDYFDIPGIDETSTTPCAGPTDGACDTGQIASHYSPPSSFPPSLYAAGLCLETIAGYTDWYLPAICEMGFVVGYYPYPTSCGSAASPAVQNIESNLVSTGVLSLSGYYWSSTEGSDDPEAHAWLESFSADPGSSSQPEAAKFVAAGARCARALTP